MSPRVDSSPFDEQAPTDAIIEAVAAREGVDVTDIEPPAYDPLYTVVNPDALDRLFRTPSGGTTNAVVVLEYEGYEVTVHGDGRVELEELSVTDDEIESAVGD